MSIHDRIPGPHEVARCTMSVERALSRRARVRCSCGATFYGRDRLGALDTWTGHVQVARLAAGFALTASRA